ncbi:MAG TPA: hypothetical protein VK843_17380 [Planctomycetota bacterium]|nr:hypothetical protein [Planctomycetota bacterium]
MNDDYLWNKTGRDREVEALEELLSPLGHAARKAAPAPVKAKARGVWPVLAILAAAAGIALAFRWWMPVTTQEASLMIRPIAAGQIDLKEYGTVQVHEGAVVSVIRLTDEKIHLRLERGTIDARITLAARPRLFQVETPATTCVDLGCHYTLSVEADGSTFVHVDLGEVAFVEGGRETWIPKDASCRAWPSRGSGTPRWDDARPELIAAIEALDRAKPGESSAAAAALIRTCDQKRDALSLWHLTNESDRAVADAAWKKLIELIGVPEGVDDARAAEAAESWKRHLESSW